MPVSAEFILPGFVMGLAGSLHCVGMCGPLALSLPVSHNNNLSRIAGGLIYNSGRIFTYTLMGFVFGSIGNLIFAVRWQNSLSIALGVAILIYLLIPRKYFHFTTTNALGKPFLMVRQRLGKLFQSRKLSSLFCIGLLNGFLPCGLVYLALSSSIISASPLNGSMFMLSFGFGTFPLMFATVLMGNYLNQSFRRKIQGAVPLLLFVMAALLILRGLNLGIPFVSPEPGNHPPEAIECH
ncbi:MAG TPA: sulfite exporter TauE/SafE family protein [Chitinophagaceae bacterium]|nr:sulfite exporter TauE/SafE family protein [Chitinophagaceae bacterium]